MNNEQINRNTPCSNTGYLNTEYSYIDVPENGMRALIDWVSITIKDINYLDAIDLLNLPSKNFEIMNSGYHGYANHARFGEIIVAWGTPPRAPDMGIYIVMSGSACRQYEHYFDLDLNWSTFFALILNFNHKFTRLDLAIDDFKGYFKIRKLYLAGKKGHINVARTKSARYFEQFNLDTGFTEGETLYIGKSNQIFRFYDKLGERTCKGYQVQDNIKFWNRYEIQLRDAIATDAARILAYEVFTIGEFVKGVIKAKMDVKKPDKNQKNKARWDTQKWWADFIGDVEKVQLSQIAPDPTIEKIGNWIDKQVVSSLATYFEAFDYDTRIIEYFFEKGFEKQNKRHEDMLIQFDDNHIYKQKKLQEIEQYFEQKKALLEATTAN